MYVGICREEEQDVIIPLVSRIDVRKDDGSWCITIEVHGDQMWVTVDDTVVVEYKVRQ